MNELDEIMNGKQEMIGFRIEGDTIGFDTLKSANWNLSPRDIENIIYTLQQELGQYKNNWEELEKWLISYRTNIDNPDFYEDGIIDCLDETLNKLKSLKEGK